MKLVRVATVPDRGAADVAREALGEAGITASLEQLDNDNPYLKGTLVPWTVWVPAERAGEAEGVLEALALELENEAEVAAVAAGVRARSAEDDDRDDRVLSTHRRRSTTGGFLLTLLMPLPVTCFYARVPILGVAFLSTFVSVVGRAATYERGTAPLSLLALLGVAKALDFVVGGIVLAVRGRGQAASERST